MHVPIWLTLVIAALVLGFGSYRIWLATRPAVVVDDGEPPPRSLLGGGFYRMGKRTHLLVGIVYLLLGGALVATSFGWNPFSGAIGPRTETPTKGNEPVKPGTVPIDHLPAPKKG